MRIALAALALAALIPHQEPTAVATATIVLAWSASPTSGVGYQIYRETEPGICTPTTTGAGPRCLLLNASPVTALTYTDAGVSTAAPVYYVVRATNANGYSGFSNEVKVTFTVPGPPGAPSNLTCTGTVAGQAITVSCQ